MQLNNGVFEADKNIVVMKNSC